ncbi:hypothetical protein Glove_444g4 [Diversispora epigaea]|uniref:Serine-threonine/tyrosine-protein kinase catalytic domain-containing protein n=1 Tax=Diversispora epigaea TaxID=1348612 RepID=A0A397GSE7_9GLOM|nr:hypothetical protein Glove_444g4 [Diversispora epigaea]
MAKNAIKNIMECGADHVIRNTSKMILIIEQIKIDLEQYVYYARWKINDGLWPCKRRSSIKKMEIHLNTNGYEYAKDGNLREYLKINFNNINWISDFGLGKLIGANPNNPDKKNIFGVLPYIAPEVKNIQKLFIIIMRCWDAQVTHRPTFEELFEELHEYWKDYYDYLERGKNKDSEIVIQIKKAEEFSANQESTNTTTTTTSLNYKTHPQAIYTSRLLNYSNLPKPKNEEINRIFFSYNY